MKPDFPHLTPPELASHAAHRLAAADILRVSDHLVECAVCREAFARARPSPRVQAQKFLAASPGEIPTFEDDLAEFRAELERLPVKVHGPAAEGKIIVPPSWRWRGTPAWAIGLAAIFVALAVAWWSLARPGNNASLLRDDQGRSADLAGLPADLRASVEAVLHTGRLPPLPASELATERGTLAGTVAEAIMTTTFPVGVIVRETRPAFGWTSHSDASGYEIFVTPARGGTVVSSPLLPATQTRWTPPAALERGETYVWQVAASRDGRIIDRAPRPPAGEARFEVLDAAGDGALARVEQEAADYPLVLGVAYWRAGLTAAAASQFDHLAKTHAQSSLAQELMTRAAAEIPGKGEPFRVR